jgi:hypothetical protein
MAAGTGGRLPVAANEGGARTARRAMAVWIYARPRRRNSFTAMGSRSPRGQRIALEAAAVQVAAQLERGGDSHVVD